MLSNNGDVTSPNVYRDTDIGMKMPTIQVKLLSDQAILPTKNTLSDAGWDLYSTDNIEIFPGHRTLVSTDVSMAIPEGYAGLIWPRSGLSAKQGIDVLAGVIDSGYRGEIKVCLLNTGDRPVIIQHGDRIAQMVIQRILQWDLEAVEELNSSERGDSGFGSSGK